MIASFVNTMVNVKKNTKNWWVKIMGRKRGTKKRIHKAVCISCGAGVGEGKTICSNCRVRQKLIRTMQQMIRDTKEQGRMATGNYWIRCFKCDRMFNYTSDAKKYCPECEKEIKRERNRKFMANKRKKKPSVEVKTISEVLREMKAYNEEHGTCLSYGQYVLMTEYQGVAKC
jgi:predicted amidophosphoribosyltransferase